MRTRIVRDEEGIAELAANARTYIHPDLPGVQVWYFEQPETNRFKALVIRDTIGGMFTVDANLIGAVIEILQDVKTTEEME